jgi:hypothetical protein
MLPGLARPGSASLEDLKMGFVIATANMKGGVGKTTLC